MAEKKPTCENGRHYVDGRDYNLVQSSATLAQFDAPVMCQCVMKVMVDRASPPVTEDFIRKALGMPFDEKGVEFGEPAKPEGVPGELIMVRKLYEIAGKFGLTLDMEISKEQPPAWGTFLSTKAPNEIFFDRLSIIGVTENAAGELFNERTTKMLNYLEANGFKLVEHEEEDQLDIDDDRQKLTYRRLMATSDLWNPKQREGELPTRSPTAPSYGPVNYPEGYGLHRSGILRGTATGATGYVTLSPSGEPVVTKTLEIGITTPLGVLIGHSSQGVITIGGHDGREYQISEADYRAATSPPPSLGWKVEGGGSIMPEPIIGLPNHFGKYTYDPTIGKVKKIDDPEDTVLGRAVKLVKAMAK